MTVTTVAAASGNTESRRHIQWIGTAIGMLWFGVWALQLFVPASEFQALRLGAKGNPFVQLAAYSFLHWSLLYVAVDLVWLAGVVRLAQDRVNTEQFIRLFSVGTIGGGGLWLLFAWVVGRFQGYPPLFTTGWGTAGGAIALVTMIGALANIRRGLLTVDTYFLGPDWGRRCRENIGLVITAIVVLYLVSDMTVSWEISRDIRHTPWSLAEYVRSLSPSSLPDRLFDFGDIAVTLYIVMNPLPVKRIAPLLVAPYVVIGVVRVLTGAGLAVAVNPFVLSYVTGLVLGTAYAKAERLFARHGGTV